MRALLDTHAFIWWVQDEAMLSRRARVIIADSANECLFSVASAWEMAIKLSIAKLSIDGPLDRFLADELAGNAMSTLPVRIAHVARVVDLPFHHRDPFDRLLAAQALVEGLAIVSVDGVFNHYGVERIW